MSEDDRVTPSTTLCSHLEIPTSDRDLEWLTSALQTAIELEHATLPLYLSAMFSLEVQNYTSYNLIRSVAMEEMVHMAIACNMLASLGVAPKIKELSPVFPAKGLPGGAEPDLQTVLAQLSPWQVENFMRLEMPAFLLPDEYKRETYPTIAALYGAIRDAIQKNADEVRRAFESGGVGNQVGDDIGFTTLTPGSGKDPIQLLDAAIQEILNQGEGSPLRDLHAGSESQYEESHYCKFAQISYRASYRVPEPKIELTRETEPQFFKGYPIPWPQVQNTLAVPKDGYAKLLALDPEREAVEKALVQFDQKYTDIMTDLELMWNGPADQSWPTFGKAVAAMTALRVLSCFYIMRNKIPEAAVSKLRELYPEEFDVLDLATDLTKPVFYGPRFRNLNATRG